jgi:sialate O-acetylesterase
MAVSNDIYEGTTNTGFAVRIHEGTPREPAIGWPIAGGSNPHPTNKQLVAGRLADIALVKTYGRPERPIFGPMYESHEIKGDKVLVKFKYAYGGLKTVNAGAPNWFEISDGSQENNRLKYVKAQARIAAAAVVEVSAPEVKEPKFVRFSWHTLARHNLVNSGGLPAVPFRTDSQDVKGWR